MNNKPGILIALEGTDGAGKSTQYQLIVDRLKNSGYKVKTIQFPRYDNESSHFVREYLKGNYGSPESVGPYTASMFYALDRYHSSEEIKKWIEEGNIVIADRFSGSNMAHQGIFFDNAEQRRGFFLWLDQIEFEMLKIPRPNLSIVLRVPPEIALNNIENRGRKKDVLENNSDYRKKSVEVYDNLCQLFPKDFKRIDCVRNNQLLDKNSINDLIWHSIEPLLPTAETKKKDQNQEESPQINDFVTNTDQPVYAFTGALSQRTVAAGMARLSRKYDDLRSIIKNEFNTDNNYDSTVLKRIISNYGDDSVQQLAGIHMVVEGASNLLTKKIEKFRLASYLEQSTRYIYYDKKNSNGQFNYYIPENFDREVEEVYVSSMDFIFENYSQIVRKLTDYIRSNTSQADQFDPSAYKSATKAQACDIARAILPVACKSTVGFFASAQTIENMYISLMSDKTTEARQTAKRILTEARKLMPEFLERADNSHRGQETTNYKIQINKNTSLLAEKNLKSIFSSDSQMLTLIDYWPKNELDLASNILFEQSSLSLEEISEELKSSPIENKREIINQYIGHRTNRRQKPGRAFESAHYSWDILSDYGAFRDLSRHRMVDSLAWQDLSPRYGYAVPKIIEQAGLEDLFISSFDESLKLYGYLQQKGLADEAQYATLLGHRMRWKFTMNAREAYHLIELRTSSQGHSSYRKITQAMYEKITEVHPLIAENMKFVNMSSDEELSRLKSEQNKIQRLKQLDSHT